MLIRFFSRGSSDSRGVMDYMLGRNRDRAGATVLRGNPDQTADLIDSLTFRRKYTSGCLSFEEKELSQKLKSVLMDSFEQALFAGLDRDQYDVTWIEHTDKNGRIELNFVIPNVELLSGRRLQPYYDKADRTRINAYQTYTNAHFDFADPNDPARRRTLSTPANLPKSKQKAAELITDGLKALISSGVIAERQGVLEALKSAGYNITRETKNSISVTLPGEVKPLRLTGAIYERDFRFSAAVCDELEEANAAYSRDRKQRANEARKLYKETHRKKSEYHRERFERPRQSEPASIRQSANQNRGDIDDRRDNRISNNAVHHVSNNKIWSAINERSDITAAISFCITALIAAARAAVTGRFDAGSRIVETSYRTDKYKQLRLTEQQQSQRPMQPTLRNTNAESSRKVQQSSVFKM